MSFGAPAWLWLLLVAPLLAALVVWTDRRHLRRLSVLGPPDAVLPPAVRRRRAARDAARIGAIVAAIVALAEPRYGKELQTISSSGVDLVVVLDLSRSMDARDAAPSRLGQARRELADLVDLLEEDRVGLVIYAGGAFGRLPLTRDRDILLTVLDEVGTDTIEAQGSALGEGIREALAALPVDSSAGGAILVVSDGEVHDAADALEAADAARLRDVPVFALGVGSVSSPIPRPDGTFLTDDQGRVVRSTPTFDVLREVARRTGGGFALAEPGTNDVTGLYVDGVRAEVGTGQARRVEREVWRSAHQPPLLLAVLLLLFAAWYGDHPRRRAAA